MNVGVTADRRRCQGHRLLWHLVPALSRLDNGSVWWVLKAPTLLKLADCDAETVHQAGVGSPVWMCVRTWQGLGVSTQETLDRFLVLDISALCHVSHAHRARPLCRLKPSQRMNTARQRSVVCSTACRRNATLVT